MGQSFHTQHMAPCSPDSLLAFPEHFTKFVSLILPFCLILTPSIHSIWLHIHPTLFSLSLSNTITCLTSFSVILMSISLESSMGWVTIRRSAPAFTYSIHQTDNFHFRSMAICSLKISRQLASIGMPITNPFPVI